jgi:hypothetical protein
VRASARVLRARGNDAAAQRAERAAVHIDLMLEEPQTVRRMHAFVRHVCSASHHRQLLERALDGAVDLLGADLGHIQLVDPRTGALRIVVHTGFSPAFLAHFTAVADTSTACGRAARHGVQSHIVDVNDDPGFAPHRSIAAASGFRAVQSTPLLDAGDRVRGVLSIHFRHPHRPRPQDLQIMAWYGDLTAAAMTAQQIAPILLYKATATCHEQAAERHDAAAEVMRACARPLWTRGARADATRAQAWAREARERALRERQRGRKGRRLVTRTPGDNVAGAVAARGLTHADNVR